MSKCNRVNPYQKMLRNQMEHADIIVYMFSPDFFDSDACMKEWDYGRSLASNGKPLFRIPVIIRKCAWKDVLGTDDVKVLPVDGNPVSDYHQEDAAWLEVYQGIKEVVKRWSQIFIPKPDFLTEIRTTEFLSQEDIELKDLFTFLHLTADTEAMTEHDQILRNKTVYEREQLTVHKKLLVHGPEKSGKTALGRHVCSSLIEEARPVLYVDLSRTDVRPNINFLRRVYEDEFYGDFSLWLEQPDKLLIIDNMTAAPRFLRFLDWVCELFERVVILVSSDVFYSFFMDETRLADYMPMKINPLTMNQQEELIRKRLLLTRSEDEVTDAFVDRVEDQVNSVIISDKIFPRYPFYVLSILQTYEGYMPTNMAITSYGHCYHVLIVASLMSAGISSTDDDINASFNFAEQLAHAIYRNRKDKKRTKFEFDSFLAEYNERYVIKTSIINRLKHPTYGIIRGDGMFSY